MKLTLSEAASKGQLPGSAEFEELSAIFSKNVDLLGRRFVEGIQEPLGSEPDKEKPVVKPPAVVPGVRADKDKPLIEPQTTIPAGRAKQGKLGAKPEKKEPGVKPKKEKPPAKPNASISCPWPEVSSLLVVTSPWHIW